MKIPASLRQHEGLALALVGGGAAVVVVLRKVQASQAGASTAAAASSGAIPADVLPVSGAGGGGGGPSGSVDTSTAASASSTSSTTPAIGGNPQAGTSGGLATSAGGDYQAPPGGTQGGSSQVPGSAGGSSAPTPGTVGQYGNTVPIAIAPSVVETTAQRSSFQGITDFWKSQIAPLLSGQGTPATRFGTVVNDAGPTAALSAPEFVLTNLGLLDTPAQITQAVKQLSPSTGPGTTPGQYSGNASTLADRANNIITALNVGQAPAAAVPALTADVKTLQDERIAQTEAAYGAGYSIPVSAIVSTWAPSDRAAYNAAHGTHY